MSSTKHKNADRSEAIGTRLTIALLLLLAALILLLLVILIARGAGARLEWPSAGGR